MTPALHARRWIRVDTAMNDQREALTPGEHPWMWDGTPLDAVGRNPVIYRLLSLPDGLLISRTVSHAARKLRNGNHVNGVFRIPFQHHRVMLILLVNVCSAHRCPRTRSNWSRSRTTAASW